MTILHALLGTLSIFLFNVVLAVAITGLGLGLRRMFGLVQAHLEDCFFAFWTGFGLVILVLMLWNFVLPVGPAALVIVTVAGLGIMAAEVRGGRLSIRDSRPPRWAALMVLAFWLWIANLSTGPVTAWDTSLYHMQGVAWARSYPVVPGLANLFGPLGFNNSSFLYYAMLDTGPWSGQAWHVALGMLVSMFGAQLLTSAGHLFSRRPRDASIHVFPLLLLPLAVTYALGGVVTSFMTDIPTTLVIMVIMIRGYQAFAERDRPDDKKAFDFFGIAALGAVAVSLKLSAAVFAASILLVSSCGALRLKPRMGRLRLRSVRWSLVAVALIGVTWAARGVVLSGYALFPNQALSFPVEWRVPFEHARAEYEYVLHSARATANNVEFIAGRVEGLGAWIRHWGRTLIEHPFDVVVPMGLAMLGAVFLLLSGRSASPEERLSSRSGWLMLLPLGFALVAWFAVAPMPHYGAAFVWSLAALIGGQAIRVKPRSKAFTRRLVVGVCLLSAVPCFVGPYWPVRESRANTSVVDAFLRYNLRRPGSGSWYWSGSPEPKLTVYKTESGLLLNVPIGWRGRCWDAPLPCTPNPAPNLRLREPGNLAGGFVVDGEWQMVNWPQAWRPRLLPAMRERWARLDRSESPK